LLVVIGPRVVLRRDLVALAITTATYGRSTAAMTKIQPITVQWSTASVTTARMKHTVRIPMEMRYRRIRSPWSSCSDVGKPVTANTCSGGREARFLTP